MDALSARTFHIKQLVAAAGGPVEFSRRRGAGRWSQAQVSQWISETNPKGIGHKLARAIEAELGLPNAYLDRLPSVDAPHPAGQHIKLDTYEFQAIDDGEELDPEANILVDEVDVMLSAGNGVLIPEFIETKFRMPFPLPWLRHAHINPKDVKLMRVHGDSMERTLFDNDRVMVNFADTRIRDGKVYAIAIGGEAKVKRLYTLRNNGLRIVSDNQNKDSEGHRIYKDEIVPPNEMETVQVLGRVIDRGGSGGL
ncbi:S24 family peptidase [Xylella fastidiosa]|uniref:Peptidase S24, S26A and S26B n=1 Tax=Xylella fastidiosa subsp. sandyi Ann-1 TaxID=155920 RepID=A0A060H2Y3_XYLFS|nr:helix-turn-helix transcriptional regulator [Xylella fastidiosa]AIC11139.1 Peptidase S24, S26A and S26B [Xylella fastidiosa subsp. sandyi Ann-1]KQH72803.1 peptidase S24 [Xylella fastidiosa]UIX80234.1 helix-turn-helix transcriptional regulator [Xylella fastidiosa subsp. sandyi]